MGTNRLSTIFESGRFETAQRTATPDLSGFTANPFGETVTEAQAQLYQAAFLKAQKTVSESQWPLAECWWN
jgi:hypothetical protein